MSDLPTDYCFNMFHVGLPSIKSEYPNTFISKSISSNESESDDSSTDKTFPQYIIPNPSSQTSTLTFSFTSETYSFNANLNSNDLHNVSLVTRIIQHMETMTK